jgi:hypothetical protein
MKVAHFTVGLDDDVAVGFDHGGVGVELLNLPLTPTKIQIHTVIYG